MIDARTAPYGAFLLRVSLGVMFLAHGLLLKVLTFTIPGTVSFFETNGYPAFFAYLVMLGEIGGGIALILGVWTASHCACPYSDHDRRHPASCRQRLAILGQEFPVFWTIALIVQALLGDGVFALSRALFATRPLAAGRPA